MTTIILYALLLALFQYWLIPASTKLGDFAYLIGSRDEPRDLSITQGRIDRAATNLKESLPAFLALCLLGMINGVDLTQLGMIWLGLRVAYVVCYIFGINPVRTVVWLASIGCLIMMALKLI
ncbi:MAG: MAPEG family protein [Pseudomonadota bacterium]